jgi:hypothetical protein
LDDVAKGGADDNANRQIYDVAAQNELFESADVLARFVEHATSVRQVWHEYLLRTGPIGKRRANRCSSPPFLHMDVMVEIDEGGDVVDAPQRKAHPDIKPAVAAPPPALRSGLLATLGFRLAVLAPGFVHRARRALLGLAF